ncbi:MAG: hypothetical protein ABJC33_08140 [Betaproteobacteria bacterium]
MRNPTGKPESGSPPSVSSSIANAKRRRFLVGLSAGGAGVAAATVAALPAAALIPSTAEPSAAASGYRETEHVRSYYRTAKV